MGKPLFYTVDLSGCIPTLVSPMCPRLLWWFHVISHACFSDFSNIIVVISLVGSQFLSFRDFRGQFLTVPDSSCIPNTRWTLMTAYAPHSWFVTTSPVARIRPHERLRNCGVAATARVDVWQMAMLLASDVLPWLGQLGYTQEIPRTYCFFLRTIAWSKFLDI